MTDADAVAAAIADVRDDLVAVRRPARLELDRDLDLVDLQRRLGTDVLDLDDADQLTNAGAAAIGELEHLRTLNLRSVHNVTKYSFLAKLSPTLEHLMLVGPGADAPRHGVSVVFPQPDGRAVR